jgi:hypothetical protein
VAQVEKEKEESIVSKYAPMRISHLGYSAKGWHRVGLRETLALDLTPA